MNWIKTIASAFFAAGLTLGAAGPAAAQYYGGQGYGMMGGGHWIFGGFMMVLFIAVVIAVIVLLAYWLTGGRQSDHHGHRRLHGPTPLDILEERFARGEIDSEEFQERRKHLSK